MIGLRSFNDFGYKIEGIPTKPPVSEKHGNTELSKSVEDMPAVDGLYALDLSDEVHEALEKNQELPLSSRCTHPLAFLRISPKNKDNIWKTMNFVSRKDEGKVKHGRQQVSSSALLLIPQTATLYFGSQRRPSMAKKWITQI